jgi:hypothetical protein
VLHAERVGDRGVGDLAIDDVDALEQRGLSVTALRQPLFASCSAYGSVAFVSASVDVRGTPPGMLATP